MDGIAEDVGDTAESDSIFEVDEQLPVEVAGVGAAFELSLDVGDSWRQPRGKVLLRYCQKPVPPLCVRLSHAGGREPRKYYLQRGGSAHFIPQPFPRQEIFQTPLSHAFPRQAWANTCLGVFSHAADPMLDIFQPQQQQLAALLALWLVVICLAGLALRRPSNEPGLQIQLTLPDNMIPSVSIAIGGCLAGSAGDGLKPLGDTRLFP